MYMRIFEQHNWNTALAEKGMEHVHILYNIKICELINKKIKVHTVLTEQVIKQACALVRNLKKKYQISTVFLFRTLKYVFIFFVQQHRFTSVYIIHFTSTRNMYAIIYVQHSLHSLFSVSFVQPDIPKSSLLEFQIRIVYCKACQVAHPGCPFNIHMPQHIIKYLANALISTVVCADQFVDTGASPN